MDQWTAEIRRWPMVGILTFGLVSNILTVLVLSRPKLRKNTCSLYLIGASVSNTLCIVVSLFYFTISNGFGYSFTAKSRVLCKLLPYLYYTTLFLASWFVLLACTDRYCSTHSQTFVRRFSHLNIAKRLLIFLPLFTLLIHIHLLIYIDWIEYGRCTFLTFNFLLFLFIYYVVVYAFMTPILYMIFAILTIVNVQKAKKKVVCTVQKYASTIPLPQRRQTLNAQLLRMLLVQVISFVILTMPLAIWNVYLGISYYQSKSTGTRSLESFLSASFRYLTNINIASTCVIYTVTARVFREELWALFQCHGLKNSIRRRFFTAARIAPTS